MNDRPDPIPGWLDRWAPIAGLVLLSIGAGLAVAALVIAAVGF